MGGGGGGGGGGWGWGRGTGGGSLEWEIRGGYKQVLSAVALYERGAFKPR